MFFDLQIKDYTPLIVHRERRRALKVNPYKLFDFVEKGAIAQVTANFVAGNLDEKIQKSALDMWKNNLVHILGSDASQSKFRLFVFKQAYEVIRKILVLLT